MKSKSNRTPFDKTAIALRAAGIRGGVRRKGEWERDRDKKIPGVPKDKRKRGDKKLDLPRTAIIAMAKDKVSGMTSAEIAAKYEVSNDYVEEALHRLYVTTKIGREILKNVLLENAVATGMHARANIKTMNGMQAAVATGIFTDRFVQLDKHIASQPIEVDFIELQQAGNALKELREMVGGVTEREVPAIDIEAEVDSIEN